MKAIAYIRVSTEDQDYNRQISDIREFCKYKKIDLIEDEELIFKEKESGSHKERPALTSMLNYLDVNPIEYVIVSELSRLGRSNEVLNTIEFLTERKICLVSLKEQIQTLDEDGKENHTASLIVGVLTSINKHELHNIHYRIKSGIRQSFMEGRTLGGNSVPFGYKVENKVLVIDPIESESVKMIFDLYIQGKGISLITDELKRLGVKSKKGCDFYTSAVYSILTNPIYTGYRRKYTEKRTKVKRDEIGHMVEYTKPKETELIYIENLKFIDKETYDKVQSMLKSNFQKQSKPTFHNYLLKNQKIICGVCGKPFQAHTSTILKSYVCVSKRRKESCGNASLSIAKIESLVQYVILNKFQDTLMKKMDNKSLKEEINSAETILLKLNKDLEKINTSEFTIAKRDLEGMYSEVIFKGLMDDVKKNRIKVLNEIKKVESNIDSLKSSYNNLKDIKLIEEKFKNGETINKIATNKIIKNIVVTRTDRPDMFKKNNDVCLNVEIFSGTTSLSYILSQRENYFMDLENYNKIDLILPTRNN